MTKEERRHLKKFRMCVGKDGGELKQFSIIFIFQLNCFSSWPLRVFFLLL